MCAASRLSRRNSCSRPIRSSAALREIMKNPALDFPLFSKNTARTVLSAAPEVLAGEIAAARGQFDRLSRTLNKRFALKTPWYTRNHRNSGSAPADARCHPAGSRTSGRSGDGVLGRSAAESQQRVGALRIDAGIARTKEGRSGGAHRGTFQQGLGTCRRETQRITLRTPGYKNVR